MTDDVRTQRLKKVRDMIGDEGLDALLIANYADSGTTIGFDHNLTYLTNLGRTYPNSFLLITQDDYQLCVDRFELERARGESWLPEIAPAPIIGYPPEEFVRLIMEALRRRVTASRPRIGVNGRRLPSSVGLALNREGDVADVSLAIEKARVVKDHLEIEAIRRACQIALAGVETIVANLALGVTELDLAVQAEYEMSRLGGEYFWAGRTMVMSGPSAVSTVGTDSSTGRKVERGHLVHIDIFPSYGGYMSDIARSIVIGKPSAQQQELADVTFAAFERAVGALVAGNRVREIKEAAFRDVRGTKYEALIRGPGHGMGLNDDLYPRLAPPQNGEIVLQDGMVIAIEVYTMLAGVGGVRYEDNFVVRGADPLRLTKAEKLIVVDL